MPLGRVRPLGMRHIIAASLCLLAAAGANAQSAYPRPPGWEWYGTSVPNGTTGISYTSSGATLIGGPNGAGAFVGRNFGAPSNGAIPMMERLRVPIAGTDLMVGAARAVSAAEIANGAAMVYGAWVAGQWVGSHIADYLDLGARVTPTGTGWQFDSGQPPSSIPGFACDSGGKVGHGPTLQTACQDALNLSSAARESAYWSYGSTVTSCTVDVCQYDETATSKTTTQVSHISGEVTGRPVVLDGCPGFTDLFSASLSRPAGGKADPDGKCPTGRYSGVPFDMAKKRMQDYGDPTAWPGMIPEIIGHGVPMAGDPMPSPSVDFPGSLTGPGSSPGPGSTTTTYPPGGGAPVTVNNTTTNNYSYVGGNTINITQTTTTNNPGGGTTETTAPKEIKVCGVPGNPPCKIDETGTPTEIADPTPKIKDALRDPTAVAKDPEGFFPKMPSLNWSFQLPTGCSAVPLPAFAPFFTSVDLCPFVPVFHDLMSVVWLVGGIFGAIRLFLQDALAS